MQVGKLQIYGDSVQSSKGYFQIASGNATTDRPGTPANSMMRYNSTNNYFEGYANSTWQPFAMYVGMALPNIFSVSGSPISGSGTLTATLATQTANTIFAAPNGSAGLPTFRAMVNSDLPATINVQTAITMPTMTAGDSSTNGATTAFVGTAITNALASVYFYKGTVDITAAPPGSPQTGWMYRVTTGGTPNAGYSWSTTVTRCDVGDHIVYNGATWDRFADVNPAVTAGAGITVTPTGDTSYAVSITNSITAGAVGSASTVPTFSYTAQGLIASASSVSIAIADSAVTWATRAQNLVFASPNGSSGVPTFRSAVIADIANTGGTAYQIVGVNSGATALEYKTLASGTGMSITEAAGLVTFNNTGVTNVGISLPAMFTTSGSPVTTTGTLTAVLATQLQNLVFASPNGSGGVPTFRAIVAPDISVGTGTAYQILGVNSGATAMEYKTLASGTGMSITEAAGLVTFNNTGVTNVGISLPNIFSTSGSPVTTTGTLTATLAAQTPNTIFAGPSSGTATAAPTFRSAVPADFAASGTAYQVLGITSSGSALEYKTLVAGTGITVTLAAGLLTIGNTGVTNVGMSLPNIFTTSGSPVTTTGTLTAVLATTTANVVFAGPNGAGGVPTFRALVAADIPALSYVTNVGISLPNIFTTSGSPVTSAGTLTAVLATQTQNLVFASPNGSSGLPTFRALVAADLPATGARTYRVSFTNASLSSSILTVTHNLNQQFVSITVYDNNNLFIEPDNITCTNTTQSTIDMTSWGTLTGTFNLVVIG